MGPALPGTEGGTAKEEGLLTCGLAEREGEDAEGGMEGLREEIQEEQEGGENQRK